MKNEINKQTKITPTIIYEVTSCLKIDNWLQLAMQQLQYYRTQNQQHVQKDHHQHQHQQQQQQQEDQTLIIKQQESSPSPINQSQLLYRHLKIYQGKVTIDFTNQQSLVSLTRCILKVVFGIEWCLPLNNLCPRIPNRLNYLIWINKYILEEQKHYSVQPLSKGREQSFLKIQNKKQSIIGVDIGTGASLIYPLLGVRVFGWKFIATQQDQQSLEHAQKLITINNYQQSIELRKPIYNNNLLLRNTIHPSQKINFTICNPPFFDANQNNLSPISVMTQSQHNTSGGQYEFFFSLYQQSFYYLNIDWFTMMIGLGRDYQDIKQFLETQLRQYYVLQEIKFGRLNQSENTRFVVAWRIKKVDKD